VRACAHTVDRALREVTRSHRGGGDRTISAIRNAQVVHSAFRTTSNNRQNRMSEVHGGYTAPLRSWATISLHRQGCILFRLSRRTPLAFLESLTGKLPANLGPPPDLATAKKQAAQSN
jgi:hypothetical protein